jgi:hypothetical protein
MFTKLLCCSALVFLALASLGIWLQKVRKPRE